MSRIYRHLSLPERDRIMRLRDARVPVSRIATALGRHPATIYRELRRNFFYDDDAYFRGYFGSVALSKAAARRLRGGKIIRNPDLASRIAKHLHQCWSPEQIAGRLRLDEADPIAVCHETIYQYVYGSEGRRLGLWSQLPRQRKSPPPSLCTQATWSQYSARQHNNDWGGSNFYEGVAGDTGDRASPVVSTLRPFSRGFAWLPEGAPRGPLQTPPGIGAAPRYPHMEWAYANGFSKKYASAGWATYDRHFARWAESQGFTVDIATQHDLHRDPTILNGYRCVVFVGHDEYWSWEMRDAIDAYVNQGGHVARFAGNFTWQIRLEADGTQQVGYKSAAETHDPVRDTNRRHLLTTFWEDMAVARPGAQTFGLNGSCGIYAGWGLCAPRGLGGFTVYRPDHWAFAGSDLYYGDVLGADAKIFGYEVDGCDYTFRNGLPYPTEPACALH